MKKLSLNKLTVEKIDALLKQENLDPVLKTDLENKRKILANQQTVKK